jgi:tyrosyl-tRNA synthetase
MSKSLENYIGVTDAAAEMFGKLMSISDDLMWRYYLLLTDASESEIAALRAQVAAGTLHPKQAKADLATRIVADFHSPAAARAAAEAFEARFSRGELDTGSLPDVRVPAPGGSIGLPRLVAQAGLAASAKVASQVIVQGGVKIDREKVTDIKTRIEASRGSFVLEVGRRAVRVTLTPDVP